MLTRLDIVNAMIASTGSRPLLAENDRHPLYMKAMQKLKSVTSTVLALGLWFNTEVRVIQPQANGEIAVPSGCIKADPADRHLNLTLRNGRMYNLDKATYNIGKPVRLKMYFNLELEDFPLEAMNYVQARCVYEYYLDDDGAEPKLGAYRRERDLSWTTFWREHIRNRQANVFDNPRNTVTRLRKGGYGLETSRRF